MRSEQVLAQVIPDGTLPTNVTSPNGLNFTIDGDSRSGNHLFHSFDQFPCPRVARQFSITQLIFKIFSVG
jgi:hypothetical protein